MKKMFSIILSVVFLICALHLNTFAVDNTNTLDLKQYTLEDIEQMSASEFRNLLADFERTYDPLGTYKTTPIMSENIQEDQISPQWTSGTTDGSKTGSHEIITAKACVILASDIGFFGETDSEQLLISLTISLASLLPDRDYTSVLELFCGHFYNPYTQENFLGSTENTAKTNAFEHFKSAFEAYNDGDETKMYEHLGRSLHYLQDACQPMHASNFTEASFPQGAHGNFEEYVDVRIDKYLDNISSVKTYDFFGKGSYKYVAFTPNYYVREAAYIAYEYKDFTNKDDTDFYSDWNYAANITVQNAAAFSALFMYSFAEYIGLSLT